MKRNGKTCLLNEDAESQKLRKARFLVLRQSVLFK